MGFSDKQVNALRRNLNGAYVRTRKIEGRELSYIEGWHAIAEANRIFGFDRWDRETVETKCVLARENRGTMHAVYLAKVRVTVRAAGEAVVREGYGTGEGHGSALGEVHERALKMAETDATKRALATFGRPFGLALYVSGRNRWSSKPQIGGAPIADDDRRRTLQRRGPSGRYSVPPRPRTAIDPALAPLTESGEDVAVAKSEPPALRIEGEDVIEQMSTKPDLAPASHLDRSLAAAPSMGHEADLAGAHPQSIAHDDHAGRPPQSEADDSQASDTPRQAGAPPLQPSAERSQLDSAALLIDRPKRRREPAHLKFVGSQPCLICGRTPSDAHHLRFAQPRALGRKVSDEFTVPLCRTHHRQVHQFGNEEQWWQAMDRDVDPLEIAKGLWEQSRKSTQTESLLRR